ncbi:MAG: hypothetical protein HC844_16680 [Tabrizicola sp.]|nr:hypothetical protein [Tabrizicola sp.]
MRRGFLLWFALLVACAPLREAEVLAPEPVATSAIAVEPDLAEDCTQGDDGIGGTGCPVD